jgi:hypothetical protein
MVTFFSLRQHKSGTALYLVARAFLAALSVSSVLLAPDCYAQTDFFEAQSPEKVRVKVGNAVKEFAVKDVAPLYAPYALLSAQSYLSWQNPLTDPGSKYQNALDTTRAWFDKKWRRIDRIVGPLGCTVELPCLRGIPIGGLEIQIWARGTGSPRTDNPRLEGCREAVIAFRGTDPTELTDWVSNFRFLFRLLPIEDEYDQVRRYMPTIVNAIQNKCGRMARLIATGHSLGGGLAQNAAYAEPRIKIVYAFDPSFVTGAADFDPNALRSNRKGLSIDRIFQAGEVLSGPRQVAESIFIPPPCNPTVREIRMNLLTGNPFAQHSIEGLSTDLYSIWKTSKLKRSQAREFFAKYQPHDPQECSSGSLY